MKVLKGLSEPMTTMDGTALLDESGKLVTKGSMIANTLARGRTEGQEARAVSIALSVYQSDGSVTLDDSDLEFTIAVISQDALLTNWGKVKALEVLNQPQESEPPGDHEDD